MNLFKKIKDIFKKAFTSGWSVERLTQSFCWGVYIAFSPFPGGHTIMMFIAKWLFRLNFPVLFVATSINNPWTMLPFFALDYAFGYWILHDILGCNPAFSISLEKIFGSGKICLVSFFIGGNVLGIIAGLMCYPFVKIIFKQVVANIQKLQASRECLYCSAKLIKEDTVAAKYSKVLCTTRNIKKDKQVLKNI